MRTLVTVLLTVLAAPALAEAQRFELVLLSAGGVNASDVNRMDDRPLIVMAGGSEGGMYAPPQALRTKLLKVGYDIATLAMFRTDALPRALVRVPLDRLAIKGRDLRTRYGKCVALVGISRGGEMTLIVASRDPDAFDAYAAIVPAHAAGSAVQTTFLNRPAWTWKGADVPYVRLNRFSPAGLGWALTKGRERARYNYRMQSALLRPEVMTSPARITVERIEKPLLLVSATRDHVWPSEPMATIVEQTMRREGRGGLVRHVRMDTDHFVARDPRYPMILTDWLQRVLPPTARPANGCR